ncbi:unnamed protein product [Amoebophrya sp. A120]|nr:unnamed protein product [Amoebophrya sp. A120]|eukprot:GSA120T00004304001.1
MVVLHATKPISFEEMEGHLTSETIYTEKEETLPFGVPNYSMVDSTESEPEDESSFEEKFCPTAGKDIAHATSDGDEMKPPLHLDAKNENTSCAPLDVDASTAEIAAAVSLRLVLGGATKEEDNQHCGGSFNPFCTAVALVLVFYGFLLACLFLYFVEYLLMLLSVEPRAPDLIDFVEQLTDHASGGRLDDDLLDWYEEQDATEAAAMLERKQTSSTWTHVGHGRWVKGAGKEA